MNHITYLIIHLVGVAAVALGTGGMMAGGNGRRAFASVQGLGLLVMLISGFGLLAKLQLGFPHFAIAKLILWVLLGILPLILRRMKVPLFAGILLVLILVSLLAWLGVMKPALW